MNRKKIRYIHLFVWLFAIFANLPYSNIGQKIPVQQAVTYLFAFLYLMVVFYIFYLFIVPEFLEKKKMTMFFAVSLVVVLIMPFFGYTILFFIKAVFEHSFSHFYNGYSPAMHMSGFYPVLTAAVFGSFFRVIINWFSTMNQKAELDRQKIAMELELLKSRMNPHFLFNTLNNIDALISTDPEKASSEIIRLSDIMRYLTYEITSDRVELSREIDNLRNLVGLYRIRIKDPESIEFEATGDMSVLLAPALFVPLTENAFKFARFRSNKPAISFRFDSSGGIVTAEIWNYYEKGSGKNGEYSGHGISGLRRRLELIYPSVYQLVTWEEESIYRVKLTIDTNEDKMHRD
jgi:two-component system, LytTR family, sensor kinase